ncbi:hypothetical protein B0H10DRAFT_1966892 [Mycena sp. CBHHK59/15]|nr:hypothetical protein B0H10DRAFT_1966892 [Mycena sp. CBHHK59/15]
MPAHRLMPSRHVRVRQHTSDAAECVRRHYQYTLAFYSANEYKGRKFESALAGPKEDNRPVLGWSLENALKCLRPDIVEAVKKNPGAQRYSRPFHRLTPDFTRSFLIAVILASEFKDRAGAPEIIQQISLQNGLNFPKVFSAIPIGANDNKFPLPMPWGHFIPDCSSDTKAVALANPVIHGTVNECLYTIYFIDPTPEHPPFLILTYHGLSSLTTEDEIKSAFLTALLSDPFVVNTAHADHSYVPNEPKPEMIFRILVEFAKIRKCAVSSKPNSAPTTAFSIILPPLSTDTSQTAVLERHLMRPEFAFNIPLQGTATPWRNSRSLLMSCTECHSVAHYKDDCLITNSDSYKAHYGHTTTDSAWYALNDDGSSSSTSSPILCTAVQVEVVLVDFIEALAGTRVTTAEVFLMVGVVVALTHAGKR